MATTPFNPVAHEALLAAGYIYEQVPADWEDVGGPESGPQVVGHQAFDQYSKKLTRGSLVEFIYIAAKDNGHEVLPDYYLDGPEE